MAETSLFGPPPVAQDRRRSLRDMCNLESILFGVFCVLPMVVAFGCSAYVAYLICSCVVQNMKFKPEEPEFQFDSASVSLFNTTSHSELTVVWCEVTLLATNPNTKLWVFYDKLDASVLFYGDNDNELRKSNRNEEVAQLFFRQRDPTKYQFQTWIGERAQGRRWCGREDNLGREGSWVIWG